MAPATLLAKLMVQRLAVFAIILTLFTSCYKDHLYVQQEWVDRNFLASSHVGTPDPRQDDPPEGQRLLIAWRFPPVILDRQLKMILTVRFWDNSEEVLIRPIKETKGYAAYNFFDERILTYRIQVVDGENEIVETWEHHFWTKRVLIDDERSKVSVSSQPKQGSVIETP